jgi:hypothetical protein
VEQTVPSRPERTTKAVRLDQANPAGGGVTVTIAGVKAITAEARMPGEVAGPAVSLQVRIRNGSARPLDVGSVVVTVTDSADAPGVEMSAPPAQPFRGTIAAGASANATYVFAVGAQRRNPIRVNVTLRGGAPVLLFTGDAR